MKIEFQVGWEQALTHTSAVWEVMLLAVVLFWLMPWTEQSSGDLREERQT